MINPVFQYYPAQVRSNTPLGNCRLSQMLEAIRNPKPEVLAIYEAIQQADEARRAELKSKLYYFTPAVYVDGLRRYSHIAGWTGLLPLDFDKVENAPELRDYLIQEYPYILATWLSSSGKGVRGLVWVPKSTSIDQYKSYFYAVAEQLEVYDGFDSAVKNCVLPLYMSYDPELKLQTHPVCFPYTGEDPRAIEAAPVRQAGLAEPSSFAQERVYKSIRSAIDKITDNGHPQLIRAAGVLGGYVGGGYLNQYEAEQYIEGLIDGNEYLSLKAPIYKRSAREMIARGMTKPLYLE